MGVGNPSLKPLLGNEETYKALAVQDLAHGGGGGGQPKTTQKPL